MSEEKNNKNEKIVEEKENIEQEEIKEESSEEEKKWYALYTQSNLEVRAKENLLKMLEIHGLKDLVDEVIVPAKRK